MVKLYGTECNKRTYIPTYRHSKGRKYIYRFISNCDPIFMLYFEEHIYGIDHYQIIRSVINDLNLLGGGRRIAIIY